MRHNLTVSYVYGLPFFKASGLTHTLLGGWQISGITVAQAGLPFSVTNGTTYGDNAGVGNGVAPPLVPISSATRAPAYRRQSSPTSADPLSTTRRRSPSRQDSPLALSVVTL